MKGQIHITEFDDMPFYMVHSIYYDYWLYIREMEEQKKAAEKQQSEARNHSDGTTGKEIVDPSSIRTPSSIAISNMMEELEDELT